MATRQIDQKYILSIDIGGSFIKATVLTENGEIYGEMKRVPTPKKAPVKEFIGTLLDLFAEFSEYQNISIGFPGYVKEGVVYTAPNLDNYIWNKIPLKELLTKKTGKPVRIVNDADMHSLAIAKGKGLEMLITLGTGLGSALVYNGVLLPHLELAHHPFKTDITTDIYIGTQSLASIGKQKWNDRVKELLKVIQTVFNYDHLYIGGGNSGHIDFPLDENISIVTNEDGIKGGAFLWEHTQKRHKAG